MDVDQKTALALGFPKAVYTQVEREHGGDEGQDYEFVTVGAGGV